MEIRILTSCNLCFFPHKARFTLQSLPMPFHKFRATVIRNESERMNSEPIHVPVGPNDTVSSHRPKKCVKSAWLLAEEIPGGVVCSSCLGNLTVRLGLHRVDEVWK